MKDYVLPSVFDTWMLSRIYYFRTASFICNFG